MGPRFGCSCPFERNERWETLEFYLQVLEQFGQAGVFCCSGRDVPIKGRLGAKVTIQTNMHERRVRNCGCNGRNLLRTIVPLRKIPA
jgi:hypothetical protein